MAKEYIIYCDESESSGRHFSNFYGGALVTSDNIDAVRSALAAKKAELNLFDEVKWTKISVAYEEKYLMHSPSQPDGVRLRLYPDQLPDTKEQIARFKTYVLRLAQSAGFKGKGISIKEDDVTDVCSHDHDVLQCLDVVLGAMQFRLNDQHLEKPLGAKRRGKRTRAKERVYKHIQSLICDIYPRFNIGISTGKQGNHENLWSHPYRHWLFTPSKRLIMPGSKKDKKKSPVAST